MTYGPLLRQKILALYDQGWQTRAIARRFQISESGCRRVKQRRHEPPRKVGGGRFKLDAQGREQLARLVEQRPDATLEELRVRLAAEARVTISIGALWNTLRRMKLSLKKSR